MKKKLLIINRNGFTLVEIILSIAILGIIAISIVPMFAYGLNFIVRSGNNSENQYLTVKSMENILGDSPVTTSENINLTTTNQTITIDFNSTSFTVDGIIENTYFDNGEYKMPISTFLPD